MKAKSTFLARNVLTSSASVHCNSDGERPVLPMPADGGNLGSKTSAIGWMSGSDSHNHRSSGGVDAAARVDVLQEYRVSDETRADGISATHAMEVNFNDKCIALWSKFHDHAAIDISSGGYRFQFGQKGRLPCVVVYPSVLPWPVASSL